MKTNTFLFALLFVGTSALFAQQTELKAGADKDTHGCITSAGYTYSQLKKNAFARLNKKSN